MPCPAGKFEVHSVSSQFLEIGGVDEIMLDLVGYFFANTDLDLTNVFALSSQ